MTLEIPTEPIGSIPRPLELIEAVAARGRRPTRARAAVRGGGPRHRRALRGHRLAGHHRRRAAQVPQLLDLLRARAAEHRARRLQDPVRRRPRPPDAAADGAARFATSATRTATSTWRCATRTRAGEAGGDLAVGAEPACIPPQEIPGYSREQFIDDLLREHETEVRALPARRARTRCRSTSPRAAWR